MALAGEGACSIASKLHEEGLKTPRGKIWKKQTVMGILKNEVYTGVLIWGKKRTGRQKYKEVDPVRIEDAHEPLISREDFEATQVLLSMQESPQLWTNVPLIYLRFKKGDSIRKIIGVDKSQKHIRFVDFFTDNGLYKLDPYLAEAYNAQIPNGFQKEFVELN